LKSLFLVIEILVLIIALGIGFNFLFQGHSIAQMEIRDFTDYFYETFDPAHTRPGMVKIELTPSRAFIIGDNITAKIEIRMFNVYRDENKAYAIEMIFPDAFVYRDIPPYTQQQDFSFLLTESQPYDTDAIFQKNISLLYIREGIYGLNITTHRLDLGESGKKSYYFPSFVTIKTLTYLEEKLRSNLTLGLNVSVYGLAFIAVGPIVVQTLELVRKWIVQSGTKA
jgi:hypothetical protein